MKLHAVFLNVSYLFVTLFEKKDLRVKTLVFAASPVFVHLYKFIFLNFVSLFVIVEVVVATGYGARRPW